MLIQNSKEKWLFEAYRRLDAFDIPIETHTSAGSKTNTWAFYFDALVCSLFLHLDLTMVTAGGDPVNLRSEVKAIAKESWPVEFDLGLQPRYIGYGNYSNINRTSKRNHFVTLTKVDGQ